MGQSLARWLEMAIANDMRAIVVRVAGIKGSTPRDTDAIMMVAADHICGTIGGGALEWTAIEHAREMIAKGEVTGKLELPLGPYLGQCCGGHVTLDFRLGDLYLVQQLEEMEETSYLQYPKLMILGAGHVGKAIAQALLPLPFATSVLDTRAEEIGGLAPGIDGRVIDDPVESINEAAFGTSFVILTHSHTMDFLAAEAALNRPDAPYVGMIGSATKKARFKTWLRNRGQNEGLIDRLVCPIGGSRVRDKRPEIIAALVAAELIMKLHELLVRESASAGTLISTLSTKRVISSGGHGS